MIHIATVHWQSDRWIDVQLRYLQRHLSGPWRAYAALGEIEGDFSERFQVTIPGEGSHADSLNRLAERIVAEADPGDTLVFLDGDAFPIAPFDEPLRSLLARSPLAAVRRDENLGDRQPHPSFCVTTAGFWSEIGGDWSKGPQWRNAEGAMVTDVGGRLLEALEQRRIEWTPILRTNVRDLHPVLFGVYGDLVYHHGAAFRIAFSRRDELEVERAVAELDGNRYERTRLYLDLKREKSAENEHLAARVLERIASDEDFARTLFMSDGEPLSRVLP
jgi:hypothetical protein